MEEKMSRKRLTERFPFLLPLRKWQRKLFFYTKMRLDGNIYAREQIKERLPFEVFRAVSPMINRNSGYDIKYQYNKAHNLKVAARKLDRLIIKPGETFSFCLAVKNADRQTPYRDGLNLSGGKISGSYGGGLCQMSNVLYWLFLHSSLTVTERHGHSVEAFPPASESEVKGVDATVSEGWFDLKVKNNTDSVYQITLSFGGETMAACLRGERPEEWEYEIYNPSVEYFRRKERIMCRAEVNRRKRKGEGGWEEARMYQNICEIGYKLPENILSKIKGGKNE